MQRPDEEAAAPHLAPAPCPASTAACAPEGGGASEPPSSAGQAQEPFPAPAPVREASASGLQPRMEKQPAYYKAEFEKLSQGKKTDFNFAACFLGFWHTLYRGCWRRFLLLYSWLGVLTAAAGLVAAHELETVVMMNAAYAGAAWHWDGTVSYTHLDVYKRQAMGGRNALTQRQPQTGTVLCPCTRFIHHIKRLGDTA